MAPRFHTALLLLLRSSSSVHYRHVSRRTLIDTTSIRWVRDRGLDHVVEREKHLRPIINIKNLIKSEPSKSIPFSLLTKSRHSLQIPTRPVEFVRRFPSLFEECGVHHLRLTSRFLEIDAKERLLLHDSESFSQQAADRLLKLLMLVRSNKLPLRLVDLFKWDLGLPDDYLHSVVPAFPDYFRVVAGHHLETVCWSHQLAASAMEKKYNAVSGEPVAFPVQYSRGFEMDKKMKNWIQEWQKLPYVSPYENAAHLSSQSDESDKWVVAVLHELLHIMVPKKTDMENVLALGEHLGIRSRFKRALLHHPGILYVSSKNRTYTVVLREGYKRGAIIDNHPMMELRNEYIHLMNTAVKEDRKGAVDSKEKRKRKKGVESMIGEDVCEDEDDEIKEEGRDLHDSSDTEVEHDEADEEDEDDEEEDENRGRRGRKSDFDSRNVGRGSSGQKSAWRSDNVERGRSGGRYPGRRGDRVSLETSKTAQSDVRHNVRQNSTQGFSRTRSRGRFSPDNKTYV